MNRRIVARNAVVAAGQVVVTSCVMFILYRYLIKTIGIEQLGIWSIVMAASNFLRIGEFGLSGSMAKYVAKYYALEQPETVSMVIQTAALSLALTVAIFLFVLYPILNWGLAFIFPSDFLEDARALLPFSFLYLWVIGLSGVFQSSLDGCLRTDLRGLLVVISNLMLLGLAWVMVSMFMLIGLVYAQLIQALATALVSWVLLRRTVKELPILPCKWDYERFKEILGYGANLQVINICVMLFEPITKLILGKFGGMSMAGIYEMTQRLVQQVRAFLLAANQVLVPIIAHFNEINAQKIRAIYHDNCRLLIYLALPFYTGLIALSPVIAELWIGHYSSEFVLFVVVLACAALIHILAGPAYFMNLGVGNLKWNVIAHLIMTAGNLILGFVMGKQFSGIGVVAGSAISLSGGGMIIVIAYHLRHKISFQEWVQKENFVFLLACGGGMAMSLVAYYCLGPKPAGWYKDLAVFLILVILLWPGLWFHPERRTLIRLIQKGFVRLS